MSAHTAEPWEIGGSIDERSPNIFARHAEPITLPIAYVHSISGQPAEANARRIVACVNACAGIPAELLTLGSVDALMTHQQQDETAVVLLRQQVADLRAALGQVIYAMEQHGLPADQRWVDAVIRHAAVVMSEMTACSFCTWQSIKRRYDGARLVPKWGGYDAVDKDGKFIAWFMELTDHCVC